MYSNWRMADRAAISSCQRWWISPVSIGLCKWETSRYQVAPVATPARFGNLRAKHLTKRKQGKQMVNAG